MDEIQNYPEISAENEEIELSHSDKAVGVLTEPTQTFTQMAKFPPRTIDWLLPFFILLLFVAISNILMMSNDNISFEIKQKQMKTIEKRFDEAVQKGQMTREQANQQLDRIQEGMNLKSPVTMIVTFVSIFIGGFILFLLINGIFYLLIKMFFKAEGSYSSVLSANGLTSYIVIIQVLAATILAFVFGRLMKDLSLASLLNSDTSTYLGFVLGKLDIISIWVYIVFGIGLAKMFHSKDTGKYIVLTFGVWIIGSLIIFVLVKFVPFLQFFAPGS